MDCSAASGSGASDSMSDLSEWDADCRERADAERLTARRP